MKRKNKKQEKQKKQKKKGKKNRKNKKENFTRQLVKRNGKCKKKRKKTKKQISYFHDHAQCIIPTLLAGQRFYKYHALRAKTTLCFFKVFSSLCRVFISHTFVRVTIFHENFKTCGPPEQWKLQIAHDRESSLLVIVLI